MVPARKYHRPGIGGRIILCPGLCRNVLRHPPFPYARRKSNQRIGGRSMSDLFVLFWTVMIFASIAWYGFLLFYVGFKGGREIRALTRTLDDRNAPEKSPEKVVP